MESLVFNDYEFRNFLNYKDYLEQQYSINISLPDVKEPTSNFLTTDILAVAFNGDEDAVKNAIASAKKLITPTKTSYFCFSKSLYCIFKNEVWLKIISKIYDVDVKLEFSGRLCVSGSIDRVVTAVSELTAFSTEYNSLSKGKKDKTKDSKIQIPPSLVLPVNVEKCFYDVQHLPLAIVECLLSWLERAFKSPILNDTNESVIILDNSVNEIFLDNSVNEVAEQSVMIIDVPKSEVQVPIIEISDDESSNSNDTKRMKRKKKKQFSGNNEMNKAFISSSEEPSQTGNASLCVTFSSENIRRVCFSRSGSEGPSKDILTEDIILLEPVDDENNIRIQPNPSFANRQLRPVVIDGSNVAFQHGKAQNVYSCEGIQICIAFFLNRGHKNVVAFVPQYRRKTSSGIVRGHEILERLAASQHVVFTPSRRVNGKSLTPYDDRFIVKLATENGGVILSNDNFRDLMQESAEWRKTIEERLLMYCFVGDTLMIPDDPLGKNGPCIEEFLSFP